MAFEKTRYKVIIVADADPASLVRESLDDPAYALTYVSTEEQALNALRAERFDVAILQLESSRIDGLRLLTHALALHPDLCVLLVGHQPDIEVATEAMRLGAYDFLILPMNAAKLLAIVERGLEHQQLLHQHALLRRRLSEQFNTANLVGESAAMTRVYEALRRAANHETPVILSGEPGTGKDFAAQTIHTQGERHRGPFVIVPCSEYSIDDLDVVLFGQAAGVLADAGHQRPGLFESANAGTLYLRNPKALSPRTVEAIVAALKSGQITRVGDTQSNAIDIRFIVSAEPGVQPKTPLYQFLQQLEVSCKAETIILPPLRERPEDIPLLVTQLLEQIQAETGKRTAGVEPDVLDLFMRYAWSGNLRELHAALRTAADVAPEGHPIAYRDLTQKLREALPPTPGEIRIPPDTTLRDAEQLIIEETMKTHGFKKEDVAKTLGIGLRTLYRKLDQYKDES
jgi:DNA-binding NtrC family response regulator